MIFPWLDGLTRWRESPVTWLIFLLNLACFGWSLPLTRLTQHKLENILAHPSYVDLQGRAFATFISGRPERYSKIYRTLVDQALAEPSAGEVGRERYRQLGELATRDRLFLEYAPRLNLLPDPVAQGYWRDQAREFRATLEADPLTKFGLSHHFDNGIFNWISYQFLHGGWGHLAGNMALFLIFGCWLERRFGSPGFLLFYLTAGIISGACFEAFTAGSGLPLVGASGSISGMMGAVLGLHLFSRDQRGSAQIKFVYALLPLPRYVGTLWLPAWVAVLFWLIPDISGWLSTPAEVGGVAHLAHIGGLFFGAAVGGYLVLDSGSSSGAKPRRVVFSVTQRGSMN